MGVQSVERAINILEKLSRIRDESKGIGVLELSRILKLKSPTVHNLLKTLVQCEYVEQIRQTSKYRLGSGCYSLVKDRLVTNRLIKISEEALLDFSHKINESIVLAIYHYGERFVVAKVEGRQSLRVDPSFFLKPDAYATATGRILLSLLNDKELKDYLEQHGFPGEKWDGISNLESLKKALIKIKKAGMDIHQTENNQIYALAVPVFGKKERLVAALGTYLPVVRFKGKHKKEIIKELKETSKRISVRLDYVG